MQCAVLSYLSCPALQYFSTLSHKQHDFQKRKSCWTQNMFWFSLQLLSETFLTLSRTERDMTRNLYRSTSNVPVIFVIFLWNSNFLDRFSKNTQISNITKIGPVGPESFHEGGRTYTTKVIVAFHKFASAPKNPPPRKHTASPSPLPTG